MFFAQVALAQQSKTDPSLEFNPHWFGQMTVSGSGSAVNSFKVKQNGAALLVQRQITWTDDGWPVLAKVANQ